MDYIEEAVMKFIDERAYNGDSQEEVILALKEKFGMNLTIAVLALQQWCQMSSQ